MIILCHWDYNEQIEKLERLVFYQRELFKKTPGLGYILYPVSKRRVNKYCLNVYLLLALYSSS
jgi:hypothetical protein